MKNFFKGRMPFVILLFLAVQLNFKAYAQPSYGKTPTVLDDVYIGQDQTKILNNPASYGGTPTDKDGYRTIKFTGYGGASELKIPDGVLISADALLLGGGGGGGYNNGEGGLAGESQYIKLTLSDKMSVTVGQGGYGYTKAGSDPYNPSQGQPSSISGKVANFNISAAGGNGGSSWGNANSTRNFGSPGIDIANFDLTGKIVALAIGAQLLNSDLSGVNASYNSGGGGNGGGSYANGGNGGSGIVILKFLLPVGTWSSDHPEIATIDENSGKVTPVLTGSALMTFSFSGLTFQTKVNVLTPTPVAAMIQPANTSISLACGALPMPTQLQYTTGSTDNSISRLSDWSTYTVIPGSCGASLLETFTASYTDADGNLIKVSPVSRLVTVSQSLGLMQNFIFYSGNGAVSNTGNSNILSGNVGSNLGAVSGFDGLIQPGFGIYQAASDSSTQGKTDLLYLYLHLMNLPVTNMPVTHMAHSAVFGSGETINPGVYLIQGAGSMAGTLNLDAMGDPNAVFVFKFNGAFSPAASSLIALMNGASSSNVFFIAQGAISIGAASTMKGTFIANTGAVSMAAAGDLEGRLLSTTGAVSFGPGKATLPAGFSTIPIICVSPVTNMTLGTAANFALFTAVGAVANTGTSGVIGDAGSSVGAVSGFDNAGSTLIGNNQNANGVTATATLDLMAGYTTLIGLNIDHADHAPAFGNGETLSPGVYAIAGAGGLMGSIILDGQGASNPVFVIKFGGAFSVAAQSRVILINGATHDNVFWVAEGAISIGALSFLKGSFIAHTGANTLGANSNLEGGLYSTTGAIGINTGVVYTNYSLCGNTSIAPVISPVPYPSASEQNTSMLFSPNPTTGILNLNITLVKGQSYLITAYDRSGNLVYSSNQFQSSINLSSQPTGFYIINVTTGSKVVSSLIQLTH